MGPTSGRSELYEFKLSLFNNGDLKVFLLFVHNFKMTIEASGTLETATKVQYLCTLVCGESLHQFNTLSSYMEIINPLTVEAIILV